MAESDPVHPIRVPPEALAIETLHHLIEEFVTREGTDYGNAEISLSSKTAAVEQQLRSGEAVIIFDPTEQTVNIVTRRIADQILPEMTDS